jgi:hypothetical protein
VVEAPDDLSLSKNPAFVPADIEAQQGDRGPPTAEYLAALARAKTLMPQKEAA